MTSPKPGETGSPADSPGGDLQHVAGMAPQSCHRGFYTIQPMTGGYRGGVIAGKRPPRFGT